MHLEMQVWKHERSSDSPATVHPQDIPIAWESLRRLGMNVFTTNHRRRCVRRSGRGLEQKGDYIDPFTRDILPIPSDSLRRTGFS